VRRGSGTASSGRSSRLAKIKGNRVKHIRYWTTHTVTSAETWSAILQLDRSEYSLEPDPVSPDFLIASEHLYVSQKARRWFNAMNNGRRVTIYFGGEAIFPDMNIFDYAVSFDRNLSLDDRICRMPTIDFYHAHLFDSDLSAPRLNAREALRAKTKFCNFIYSNPRAHPMRDNLFYKLSAYKRVDSLGSHLNNVGSAGSRTAADWRNGSVAMKQPYKFSIACENAVYSGYTTEKILSSFQARTVPIYWGDPSIAMEFNPKAFVNAGDHANLDAVLQAVQTIDRDDDRWIQMASEPIMTAEQNSGYQKDHRRYVDFIKHIFDQDLAVAKRAPVGFWPSSYRRWFDSTSVGNTFIQSVSARLRGQLRNKPL
jgi:hypothetical protein